MKTWLKSAIIGGLIGFVLILVIYFIFQSSSTPCPGGYCSTSTTDITYSLLTVFGLVRISGLTSSQLVASLITYIIVGFIIGGLIGKLFSRK